jgi:hypothetical protein
MLPSLTNTIRRMSSEARPPLNKLPFQSGNASPVYHANPEGAASGSFRIERGGPATHDSNTPFQSWD